jgi:polyketide cyclase/dehydrase/lipid transport protein
VEFMTYRISASAHVSANRDALFAQITDLDRLPQWNRAITEVVGATEAPLGSGSIWKVKIRAMGRSWVSRSEACVVDKAGGRFTYRSQSDDGNPSYAVWDWQLEPSSAGTRVTISVDLEPLTFWRRHLLVHLRRPSLQREMRASLAALVRNVVTTV